MTNDSGVPDEGTMYFSPKTCAFYPGAYFSRYGIGWPTDAVAVTDEVWSTFSASPPAGMIRGAVDGVPAWTQRAEPSDEDKARALNNAVTSTLNDLSRSWGYTNGIDNATTWATSKNSQFAAEGSALSTYRDLVWDWVASQPAGTTNTTSMPVAPARPTITQGSV